MITVILVIHLLIAIAMVALILLQRSEGGALGIGGSGGGPGLMSGRAAGNLLTRSTGVLAAAFMATSMTLAILASNGGRDGSVLDATPADDLAGPAALAPITPGTADDTGPVGPTPPMAVDGPGPGAATDPPRAADTPTVPLAPLAD
ncbi:preprotein translocase subunit SecG [Roseospira visakhapatnamensis]|uniref:Protein-export membrane protein SecG n=1 Tax=Roseospira visakhapatnamensis TaxID=390880 RepID=A0A7W6WA91_9PROT|nr:preprotein translocase subunit SecG [Roseospira visakhapatnamensis]